MALTSRESQRDREKRRRGGPFRDAARRHLYGRRQPDLIYAITWRILVKDAIS
jgi:hypothetical protein